MMRHHQVQLHKTPIRFDKTCSTLCTYFSSRSKEGTPEYPVEVEMLNKTYRSCVDAVYRDCRAILKDLHFQYGERWYRPQVNLLKELHRKWMFALVGETATERRKRRNQEKQLEYLNMEAELKLALGVQLDEDNSSSQVA